MPLVDKHDCVMYKYYKNKKHIEGSIILNEQSLRWMHVNKAWDVFHNVEFISGYLSISGEQAKSQNIITHCAGYKTEVNNKTRPSAQECEKLHTECSNTGNRGYLAKNFVWNNLTSLNVLFPNLKTIGGMEFVQPMNMCPECGKNNALLVENIVSLKSIGLSNLRSIFYGSVLINNPHSEFKYDRATFVDSVFDKQPGGAILMHTNSESGITVTVR